MLHRAIEQPRVPPQLRRPPERERAAQAVRLHARLAVVTEQHVHRAHEPVLTRGVELHRVSVLEHARPAGQRDVVEVDDVEAAAVEHVVQLPSVHPRLTREVRGEGRTGGRACLQPAHRDARCVGEFARVLAAERAVGVRRVDDRHGVAAPRERVRQLVRVGGITAEVKRRIEGRDHADGERLSHGRPLPARPAAPRPKRPRRGRPRAAALPHRTRRAARRRR